MDFKFILQSEVFTVFVGMEDNEVERNEDIYPLATNEFTEGQA